MTRPYRTDIVVALRQVVQVLEPDQRATPPLVSPTLLADCHVGRQNTLLAAVLAQSERLNTHRRCDMLPAPYRSDQAPDRVRRSVSISPLLSPSASRPRRKQPVSWAA